MTQNSKEVDPAKIQELTEGALTLRDAFGFEVNETMRAANMLMDQFGISGEEAYNLIAQGAQNGLNKNGDLLDTINDYAVHFKQTGRGAEDFLTCLKMAQKKVRSPWTNWAMHGRIWYTRKGHHDNHNRSI